MQCARRDNLFVGSKICNSRTCLVAYKGLVQYRDDSLLLVDVSAMREADV